MNSLGKVFVLFAAASIVKRQYGNGCTFFLFISRRNYGR